MIRAGRFFHLAQVGLADGSDQNFQPTRLSNLGNVILETISIGKSSSFFTVCGCPKISTSTSRAKAQSITISCSTRQMTGSETKPPILFFENYGNGWFMEDSIRHRMQPIISSNLCRFMQKDLRQEPYQRSGDQSGK
jgi:hypothetical protein